MKTRRRPSPTDDDDRQRKRARPPAATVAVLPSLPWELWTEEVMRWLPVPALARLASTCRTLATSPWHRHVQSVDTPPAAVLPLLAPTLQRLTWRGPDTEPDLSRFVALRELRLSGINHYGYQLPRWPQALEVLVLANGCSASLDAVEALPRLREVIIVSSNWNSTEYFLQSDTFSAAFLARTVVVHQAEYTGERTVLARLPPRRHVDARI